MAHPSTPANGHGAKNRSWENFGQGTSFDPISSLRRFSRSCGVSDSVQGGFFLRKNPRQSVTFPLLHLENRSTARPDVSAQSPVLIKSRMPCLFSAWKTASTDQSSDSVPLTVRSACTADG